MCSFRITGRIPQFWDPLTGHVQQSVNLLCSDVQTTIPLRFNPYGSMFVVFINKAPKTTKTKAVNYKDYKLVMAISGPWQVAFDPQWGGPEEITFDKLISWINQPKEGIKFYSGKATYRKTFTFNGKIQTGSEYILDLGEVGDIGIAQVTLNGRDLGVLWTKPFRVDITDSLKQGVNQLQVNVVNSWRNRLVSWLVRTTAGDVFAHITIGNDGTIFANSKDRRLWAFNPDGTVKWNNLKYS